MAADHPLEMAMDILDHTATGSHEIHEAQGLDIPIHTGPVSKTNVTATRSIQGDQESFTFKTEVVIAADKDPVFQALDLAHELVHATEPKGNPFDPKLSANDYVRQGIEGKGGEAAAIGKECEVGREIVASEYLKTRIKADQLDLIKARCQVVWKASANDSKWKQSFYFMGQYYRDILASLGGLRLDHADRAEWEEKLEARTPLFSSAVAHKPYPLALLEEYVDITRKVCGRAQRARGMGRTLASIPLLKNRCEAVGIDL